MADFTTVPTPHMYLPPLPVLCSGLHEPTVDGRSGPSAALAPPRPVQAQVVGGLNGGAMEDDSDDEDRYSEEEFERFDEPAAPVPSAFKPVAAPPPMVPSARPFSAALQVGSRVPAAPADSAESSTDRLPDIRGANAPRPVGDAFAMDEDDEFGYAFDGGRRQGETHVKAYKPPPPPANLVTNVREIKLET